LVTLLVFGGEGIPPGPVVDLLEFDGEELGNITKLGFGILLLNPCPIRVGIEKERTHVTLGTVRILLLLLLTAALGLRGDLLNGLINRVNIFLVRAHGCGGINGE